MADWNPALYLKFGSERTQPSIDLAARIPLENPRSILDVGCGPGNSTEVVAARFPGAVVSGMDNSPAMLEEAKRNYPNFKFELCDAACNLSSWTHRYDVVFSNACLQWLPDHPRIIGELINLLNPGGMLAVQIPNNLGEPIHRAIIELTEMPRWKAKLENARPHSLLASGEYYDILSLYTGQAQLWQTIYYHVLDSQQDILQWIRGTALRPFLNMLSPEEGTALEAELMERIVKDYPLQRNGKVIFPFPRLFFTFLKES